MVHRRLLGFVSVSQFPPGPFCSFSCALSISWRGSVCLCHVKGEKHEDHRPWFTWHRIILKRVSPIQSKFPTRGTFCWPSTGQVHLLCLDPLGHGYNGRSWELAARLAALPATWADTRWKPTREEEEVSGRYFLPCKCGGMSRDRDSGESQSPREEASWRATPEFQMGGSFLAEGRGNVLTGAKIGNLEWNVWLRALFSGWEWVWGLTGSRRALASKC